MKKYLAITLLAACCAAHSQCVPVEFAELQTYSKDELKAKYCSYKKTSGQLMESASQATAQGIAATQANVDATLANNPRLADLEWKRMKDREKARDKYFEMSGVCDKETSRVKRLLGSAPDSEECSALKPK